MTQQSSRFALLSIISYSFVISSYVTVCDCAPATQKLHSKNTWKDDNIPKAVLASVCDPKTGRCRDLLPSEADARDNYIVEQHEFYDRTQSIHTRAASQSRDSVYTNSGSGGVKNPTIKTRHAKKDMFMSRGWGAGGMPFSVLYMHPRVNHSSSSGSNQADTNKNSESPRKSHVGSAPTLSTTTTGRLNPASNRLTLRNNNSGQPRRHFSILPHLFLSYGWGPSGK